MYGKKQDLEMLHCGKGASSCALDCDCVGVNDVHQDCMTELNAIFFPLF